MTSTSKNPGRRRALRIVLLLASLVLAVVFVPKLLHLWSAERAIRSLRSDDQAQVRAAEQRLVDLGQAAVGPLLREMKGEECPIRREVARILRTIDARGVVDELAAGLDAADPDERSAAVRHLGVLEAPEAIPLVRPLLEDTDGDVFRQAVITLSFLGDREILPVLRRELVEGRSEQRAAAAYGLGYLEDREAIELLIRSVRRDENPAVRYQTYQALERLGALPEDLVGEGIDGLVEMEGS
jgi:HEAT repeat protein